MEHPLDLRPTAHRTSLPASLSHIMRLGIEHGVFPGGTILVRHRNEVIFHEAYGHSVVFQDARTPAPSSISARCETMYDLASLTKLFTATCVLQLLDEGKIRLDEPVARHVAGFAVNGKSTVTIRQLLSHMAGLPYVRLWEAAPTSDARMRYALAVRPHYTPGSNYVYHDTNFILLGALIEAIERRNLERVVADRVLDPLGLERTRYGPLKGLRASAAATEDQSSVGRGMVWGEVHDENAWSLGGVAGHAGLFGTASDLAIVGQAYLNGGAYGGVRLLKPETAAEMTHNQIGHLGNRGLGWQLNAPHYMGGLASPQAYGHTGFTGTSIVIDPHRQLIIVLLTNRVHPTRTGPDVNPISRAVADAARTTLDAT